LYILLHSIFAFKSEVFMNRIFYCNNADLGSFDEIVYQFSQETPYVIQIQQFQIEETSPMHYDQTIEIVLYVGLSGTITINGMTYSLEGTQLFFIPPHTVHSSLIHPGDGRAYLLKISLPHLEHYVSITRILASDGLDLSRIPIQCPDFDDAFKVITDLINYDGQWLFCLGRIISLFHNLCSHSVSPKENTLPSLTAPSNDLSRIMEWTQRNYARKITLEEVAALTGYSKYYFCNWFKEYTGSTYFNYLNQVRLENARLMLHNGHSIQYVCDKCGFCNISYFIQAFKKVHHTTPKKYLQQHYQSEGTE